MRNYAMTLRTHHFSFLLLILFMVACTTPGQDQKTQIIPTGTLTPTKLPTITPVPIFTPTMTTIPSPTPQMTLSLEDKRDKVRELQETNGGCNWPCWWGITPGKTSFEDVKSFLDGIATYHSGFDPNEAITGYSLLFPTEDDDLRISFRVRNFDHKIDFIQIINDKTSLYDFLSKNGKPGEIWFSAEGNLGLKDFLFMIIFSYPDSGIARGDIGGAKFITRDSGDYLSICVKDFGGKNMYWRYWLWSPKNSITEFPKEIFSSFSGVPSPESYFFRLGEYTNMDEEKLYNGVMTDLGNTCIETPAEIW
jgi:hypothetical protein